MPFSACFEDVGMFGRMVNATRFSLGQTNMANLRRVIQAGPVSLIFAALQGSFDIFSVTFDLSVIDKKLKVPMK